MKPLSLLALLILAGCGGSAKPATRSIEGNGFRFTAPAAWPVVRNGRSVAATHGAVDHLEVIRFSLQKTYRPAAFAAASRELDGVIAKVADQLQGTLVARRTVDIAGRRSRSYRIDYGRGRVEQIAFVLEGRVEYQLLCRRLSAASSGPCDGLFRSFELL